jgi:hypothetical protein
MSEVDRLIQMRILPDSTMWRYQLLEMPLSLLAPVADLDRNLFAPDGPSIPIVDAVGPCFTLKLDRSDSKITFAKIPVARCIEHARWSLPKKDGDA